ncbi:nitroreductase family protein [Variovorax sp. GT1P44]|uniref:nitroreductase family protein n=1 Tax=Variovorax sp. GT1P44 TaxID=3443742 RepID=UPI003F4834F3
MLSRRSVSPKRLCGPGPSPDELGLMVDAALRAPDHAGLLPWRLVEFPPSLRERLADLFAAEKLRRDPVAPADDIERAREHATHAPVVLAFVVRPQRHVLVPTHEQWLSAGAALGNLLLAAHTLGYGAIMLSGERCQDDALRAALGLTQQETLAGFVSMGAVAKSPPPTARPTRNKVLSAWEPTHMAEMSADWQRP